MTRNEEKRALEALIVSFRPDGIEAEELLHAVMAAIKSRYEDAAQDALEALDDACEALVELYDTQGDDPLNAFANSEDEAYDLEQARRQVEEAV